MTISEKILATTMNSWMKFWKSWWTRYAALENVRIGGEDFPKEVVRSRLLKLDSEHIEYVISSLRENTTKVRNIRAYLLTSLYNAPTTISSYFTALVNHDLYGSG